MEGVIKSSTSRTCKVILNDGRVTGSIPIGSVEALEGGVGSSGEGRGGGGAVIRGEVLAATGDAVGEGVTPRKRRFGDTLRSSGDRGMSGGEEEEEDKEGDQKSGGGGGDGDGDAADQAGTSTAADQQVPLTPSLKPSSFKSPTKVFSERMRRYNLSNTPSGNREGSIPAYGGNDAHAYAADGERGSVPQDDRQPLPTFPDRVWVNGAINPRIAIKLNQWKEKYMRAKEEEQEGGEECGEEGGEVLLLTDKLERSGLNVDSARRVLEEEGLVGGEFDTEDPMAGLVGRREGASFGEGGEDCDFEGAGAAAAGAAAAAKSDEVVAGESSWKCVMCLQTNDVKLSACGVCERVRAKHRNK
jgi:hypothetical protein